MTAIRMTVFVDEQGVDAEVEMDELDTDPSTVHVLAESRGACPVAVASKVSLTSGRQDRPLTLRLLRIGLPVSIVPARRWRPASL